MKAIKTLTLLMGLCAVVLFVVGCDKKEGIEIPFTEYSLIEISCEWTRFDHDDEITIIRNSTDLKKYITCSDTDFPEIDFSKWTLLCASGGTIKGIQSIEKRLYQISNKRYNLYIDIVLDLTDVAQPWSVLIKVPRLPQNAIVYLIKKQHH